MNTQDKTCLNFLRGKFGKKNVTRKDVAKRLPEYLAMKPDRFVWQVMPLVGADLLTDMFKEAFLLRYMPIITSLAWENDSKREFEELVIKMKEHFKESLSGHHLWYE